MKNKKYKILTGILVMLFCMFLGCKKEEVYLTDIGEEAGNVQYDSKATESKAAAEEDESENTSVCVKPKILVHICGAVQNPGVYEVTEDERICHAVQKAGGFSEKADTDYLNQAQKLTDGMQIYIPTREEVLQFSENGETKEIGVITDAMQETVSESLININTAGKEELCTLPGIGEGKAQKIIDYRTKTGKYQSIEEIMNVEGIKQGLFNKIKDSITVS